MNNYFLAEKKLIENYIKKTPNILSTCNFNSLFAWSDYFEYKIKEFDGNLCIFAHDKSGCFMILPPLGKTISPEAVKRSFDYMISFNKKARRMSRIENVSNDQLKCFPEASYSSRLKSYEYVYFKKDLVELKGNAYKSKRSAYNNFTNNHKFKFCVMKSSMADDCLKLYREWAKGRRQKSNDKIYHQMLEENELVHKRMMKNFDRLDLIGRVVIIGGKITGYTFGYPLNKENFCIFAEVTDLTIKGLSVFIFRDLCSDSVLEQYKFINVMDDSLMKNIHKVKMSFKPKILIPSYTISKICVFANLSYD